MDELSDQIRLLLQGGIQRVLHSFADASFSERDDLNTLMAFYRAMHSMSLNAIRLERKLHDTPRQTDGLFREFGARTNNRLPETPAAENANLRFAGRDANGTRYPGTEGSSFTPGEGGITRFVLDFGRSEDAIVVREQES